MIKLKILTFALVFCMAAVCSAAERNLVTNEIPMDVPWATAGSSVTLPQRSHPYLFLDHEELVQIATRAKARPWATKEFNKLIAEADAAVARSLEIPDKPGEWSHHYVCKVCGIDLERRGDKNICPRCGREYKGWPYDGVVAGRKHHQNIDDAKALGLAYQLTSKAPYADKCRAILLGYADRYQKYPIHDYRGGKNVKGAKLFAQTLDESVRMIPLVWSYDLVHDAPGMTPADRNHIENDLFRPAALVIRRNDMGISNWQSWHNAAMAAIGFTLGDAGMVDHAINGKSGINFQLEHSVLPDGFWYEATASYHFYALNALQWQALCMKSAGMDLYKQPVFRSLYEAPLDYAFPDGRFPAVNDSDPVTIKEESDYYEVAYSWYHEPRLAAMAVLGGRDSLAAFLWGQDELPAGKPALSPSENFPGLGATMLRQNNADNPLAVHLDYGPHGGAHGHFDKLGIIVFANGEDVIPDPGRLAYAAPLHAKWYKTTVAHNTVIVDGKNQDAAQGALISSHFDGLIQQATAACDSAYKDVVLTRSVALAPEYLLDVVSGTSTQSHTWDLAWHVQGKPETALNLKSTKLEQDSDGYQVLENVRSIKTQPNMTFGVRFTNAGKKGGEINLLQTAVTTPEIILADGVTGGDVTTCPVVITRQNGKSAQWITLVAPRRENVVTWQILQSPKGCTISVKTPTREDRYDLSANGELILP